MKKTIILYDDYIEVLQDGYNIIDRTIYDCETTVNDLVKELEL